MKPTKEELIEGIEEEMGSFEEITHCCGGAIYCKAEVTQQEEAEFIQRFRKSILKALTTIQQETERDLVEKIKLMRRKENLLGNSSTKRTYNIAYNDALLEVVNSLTQEKEEKV